METSSFLYTFDDNNKHKYIIMILLQIVKRYFVVSIYTVSIYLTCDTARV